METKLAYFFLALSPFMISMKVYLKSDLTIMIIFLSCSNVLKYKLYFKLSIKIIKEVNNLPPLLIRSLPVRYPFAVAKAILIFQLFLHLILNNVISTMLGSKLLSQSMSFVIVIDNYSLFFALTDIYINIKNWNSKVVFTYLIL